MTEIIKNTIMNNLEKKLKIVIMNDFIYHGYAIDVDEEFVSIRLDKSADIKIVRLDIIKEVIIVDAN